MLNLLLFLQTLEHFGSIVLQRSALGGGFDKAEGKGQAALCGCCELQQHGSRRQREIAMGGTTGWRALVNAPKGVSRCD